VNENKKKCLLKANPLKEVINMGFTDALLWCMDTERKMNDRSGIYGIINSSFFDICIEHLIPMSYNIFNS